MLDPIKLAQELIRYETINPPGNETPCAEHIGNILERAGFEIAYYPLDGDPTRANLIAQLGGNGEKKPMCFSGHTDVVPLGAAPWSVSPFAADIADGKIYGRGSTDMKGGDAALISAAVELAPHLANTPGLMLVITADEERGCGGANFLAREGLLGEAGAVVIAEPTSNRPLNGHKGVLRVEGRATGVTAHGSMPEKGDNAVYKAARVIGRLETLDLAEGHVLKGGQPTLNVGWFHGGMNINSVPDEAKFGIDIRIVPGLTDQDVLDILARAGASDVQFEPHTYFEAIYTEPDDPWIAEVRDVTAKITGEHHEPAIATYFTDAVALKKAYGAPTIILGPGEAAMAHQTDEYCYINRIEEARSIYIDIARRWCGI